MLSAISILFNELQRRVCRTCLLTSASNYNTITELYADIFSDKIKILLPLKKNETEFLKFTPDVLLVIRIILVSSSAAVIDF